MKELHSALPFNHRTHHFDWCSQLQAGSSLKIDEWTKKDLPDKGTELIQLKFHFKMYSILRSVKILKTFAAKRKNYGFKKR